MTFARLLELIAELAAVSAVHVEAVLARAAGETLVWMGSW